MWYVVQTTTGKEQELVNTVKKLVPEEIFKDCFIIKRELLKRLGGAWVTVTETLFPSYLFVDTENVEQLFYELKRVPEFAKILGNTIKNGQCEFCVVENDERDFLLQISDENYVVRSTKLFFNSDGDIEQMEGPLSMFGEQIDKFQFRKRFAVVRMRVSGKVRTTHLGIEF